jgi:hypothetical protein
MRWDNLFEDLEGQLEHELGAEELDLRAEEERLRLGRLSLRDRLVALVESYGKHEQFSVLVALSSGESITVQPRTAGRDWMSADARDGSTAGRQFIVPFDAITGIGMSADQVRRSLTPLEPSRSEALTAKLGIRFVLRDLARRRVGVELVTTTGPIPGTIDRVGRDHADVAVHERGRPRRESDVIQHRLVPLAHLVLVRV